VRLVHRPVLAEGPTADERVLAADIEFADSFFEQLRGLMFRRSFAEGSALVFRFNVPKKRDLHMVCVPFAIDALWILGTEVTHKKRLRPWIGIGRANADMIIELPAGAAENVAVGDTVEVLAD